MSPMLKSLRGPLQDSCHTKHLTVAALLLASLGGACNPYERRAGEYLAGSVDPIKFPSAYLGAGGRGNRPGGGTFQYANGFVRGTPVVYYPLPFNGRQAAASDPLDLSTLTTPLAYVFDPASGDAAPDSDKCAKPQDYVFDKVADAVRYDRQGNIFTKLPVDSDPVGKTTYVPIVKEVVVTSNSNPCQGLKSEAALVKSLDVTVNLAPPPDGVANALPTGRPSGRYLAYAIIDPAADVQPPDKSMLDPVTGLGPQRWGWFQQYLLAYLDGGYIPLKILQPGMTKLQMQSQNLYYPDTIAVDDPENPGTKMLTDGDIGMGLDLMEYKRGEGNYSPICRVFSFTPKDPMVPEQSVAEVIANADVVTDTKQYVYCLQTK